MATTFTQDLQQCRTPVGQIQGASALAVGDSSQPRWVQHAQRHSGWQPGTVAYFSAATAETALCPCGRGGKESHAGDSAA